MVEKVRCEICDKNLKDAQGLEQHNASKHSSNSDNRKSSINNKKIKNWAIFIIITGVIVALGYWMVSSAISNTNLCETADATEINIGSHTNLAMHIHPSLRIVIDGQEQLIPASIGIGPGLMRPVHTHDATGKLHVEGPCKRDFILEDFFKVWRRDFNSQCIFDNCADSGALTMTVNGIDSSDFQNLILKDEDKIVIEYSSN